MARNCRTRGAFWVGGTSTGLSKPVYLPEKGVYVYPWWEESNMFNGNGRRLYILGEIAEWLGKYKISLILGTQLLVMRAQRGTGCF